MEWKPSQPVISCYEERLSVDDYGSDLSFDMEEGDLVIENGDLGMVSGLDSFKQSFQSALLSNKTLISQSGLQEYLPLSNAQNEFQQQCKVLADQIVNHKYSDSKPGTPNGIGHTVEEVLSIERVTVDGKLRLLVEIKATGYTGPLKIDIPIYRVVT